MAERKKKIKDRMPSNTPQPDLATLVPALVSRGIMPTAEELYTVMNICMTPNRYTDPDLERELAYKQMILAKLNEAARRMQKSERASSAKADEKASLEGLSANGTTVCSTEGAHPEASPKSNQQEPRRQPSLNSLDLMIQGLTQNPPEKISANPNPFTRSGPFPGLQPKAPVFIPSAWLRNVVTIQGIPLNFTLRQVLNSIRNTGRIFGAKLDCPHPKSLNLVATIIFTTPLSAATLVRRGLSINKIPFIVDFQERPFPVLRPPYETRVLRIRGPAGLVTMKRLQAVFGHFRSVERVEVEANWDLNKIEHVVTWYFAGIEQATFMLHHINVDRTLAKYSTLEYLPDPCEQV